MHQILGFVEQSGSPLALDPGSDDHIPHILLFPRKGVTEPFELGGASDVLPGPFRDHRIAGILLPRSHAIVAYGDALHFGPHARIDDGGHAVMNHAAARIHAILVVAAGIRCERYGQMLPVYEILAHSVAPRLVRRFSAIRIVLEEHVVFALIEDRTIGIVDPVGRRRQVIHRTKRISRCPCPGFGDTRVRLGDERFVSHIDLIHFLCSS